MNKQKIGQVAKRLLALFLTLAISVNSWMCDSLFVQAAETYKVMLNGFLKEADADVYTMEYTGNALLTDSIEVAVTNENDVPVTAEVSWTKEGNPVTEILSAGEYVCTAENEEGFGKTVLKVLPKELSVVWGEENSFEYNGKIQVPSVQVGDWNVTLENNDLPVALKTTMADKNQGTYEATVVLNDSVNYQLAGETSYSYTVLPKTLIVDWGILEFTYDGSVKIPAIIVNGTAISADSNSVGMLGDDCLVLMDVPEMIVPASEYNVTLSLGGTDKENYVLNETTKVYSVKAKSLKSEDIYVEGLDEQCSYLGTEVTLSDLQIYDGTKKLTEGIDYTAAYSDNITVSDAAKVTIHGIGNYTDDLEENYSIIYNNETMNVKAFLKGVLQLENRIDDTWFADAGVSVWAPKGWKISTSQEGPWTDIIPRPVADKEEQVVTYYLKKDTKDLSKAYISDKKTVTYYVDTTAPEISKLEVSDSEKWTQSKKISIEVEGDNIRKVSYVIGNSTEEKDVELIDNRAEIVISDYLDEKGVEYTFTVVDYAGHVVNKKAIVKMIDVTAPTLSVKSKNEIIKDTIYTNITKDFEIVTDDAPGESGIAETALKVMKSVDGAEPVAVDVVDRKFSMSQEDKDHTIVYYVNVADNSGREAKEFSFTVIYDTTAPKIENKGLYEGTNTEVYSPASYNEADILWINSTNDTLVWKIDANDERSGIASVEIHRGQESIPVAVLDTSGVYEVEIKDQEYTGLYIFQITDHAGNKSSCLQYVKVDRIPSTFASMTIEGEHNGDENNKWYSAKQVEFVGDVSSNCAEIIEVFATTADTAEAATDKITLTKDSDGCYRGEIQEADFDYQTYYFYAIDEAGNITKANTTQRLRRDSQAPDAQGILISFSAADQGESISLPDSSIYQFVNYVKHLFVKNYLKATVYVPDTDTGVAHSGVEELTLTYNNVLYTLKCEAGNHAYIKNDDPRAYSVFEVILPENADGKTNNINSKIVVTGLVDYAGNSCKADASGVVVENDAMIVVDDIKPILNKTEYTTEQSILEKDGKVYHFYQMDDQAAVNFEIEETHFDLAAEDGTKSTPVYQVKPDSETAMKPVWNFTAGKAIAAAKFPGEALKETEYTFSLKYKDPSGNWMTGSNGNAENICDENGTFHSEIIVIDDAAPLLTRFEILSNGGNLLSEDGLYYAENLEKEDIQIHLSIHDNDTYFNEESIFVEYSADGITWNELNTDMEWTKGSDVHSAIYYFDGTESGEDTYQFRVSYIDRANNLLVLPSENKPMVNEMDGGVYTSSQKVVIDHSAPKLTEVVFSEPIQMFEGEDETSNGKVVDKINGAKTKLYYDEDAEVTFYMEDGYLKAEDVSVIVYQRAHKAAVWEATKSDISIDQIDLKGGKTYHFTMPSEDSEYYFTITYSDRAGNMLVYAGTTGELENKSDFCGYKAPAVVKDTMTPEYTVDYSKTPKQFNSVDSIETTLKIKEMNLDTDRTLVTVQATDINGKKIEVRELDGFTYDEEAKCYTASWAKLLENMTTLPDYSATPDLQTLVLELSTEANYVVTVEAADKVSKKIVYQNSYCIDTTVPTITVVTENDIPGEFTNDVIVKCGLLDFEKSDVTYSVINNGAFAKIINKLTFGYFAQAKLIVHVKIHDQVSGVSSIVPMCVNEGKDTTDYKILPAKTSEADLSIVQYDIELPIDFKGTIQMHGIDHAENVAEDAGAIGMIAETKNKHEELAKNAIEVLTSYSKTPNYYDGNVEVKFTATDGYSGFDKVNYKAGNYKETVSYPAGEEICMELTHKHMINAPGNNENNLEFALEFMDNAGHTSFVPENELPIVHIDTTAPVIEIHYDNNAYENEKYYKEKRIATVTVTERNFDPNDTIYELTGPSVHISGWNHVAGHGCGGSSDPKDTYHTDSCKWQSTVEFWQDGDYTFSFSTIDLAGNKAVYGRTDEFVIDQTIPEIKVTYDNNDVMNEVYYNAPRTATIEITEHNFSAADALITMTASLEGKEISIPTVNGWSGEGDIYRATINYDYDADYTFDIAFKDLAGNEAVDYEEDGFTVDLTAPEIEIFDIEDFSANNDVVTPSIRYSDTNYDADGTIVEMNGYKNGAVEMTGVRNITANGVEFKLDDFKHVPEMDDMYTMNATVYDLAGNSSEASVMFSVNRFGSVYTFDEKTEALVGENGSYYTDKEQELVVYETNVDTLEFQEITMNLNGKLTTLVEGEDYEVSESGDDKSWKQYTYSIYKENFEDEGTYILTIYSEDRAENTSDNHTKGKNIEFVVDKTSPSVLITGVEDNIQYREENREVTLDVEDNVRVGSVKVILNDEATTYTDAQIAEMNGKIIFTIDSSNHWQTLKAVIYDAAGNLSETEEIRFLITPNIFIQFYMNKPLFFGSITLIAATGGIWWFMAVKKKKKEEAQG